MPPTATYAGAPKLIQGPLVASGFSSEEGWGTTRPSREYLHKGRFLKEWVAVQFPPHMRDSQLLLTHWAALKLPVQQLGILDSNWNCHRCSGTRSADPSFQQGLKISSHKVLNNHSRMAARGEHGCYRDLSSTMLLFAHGSLLLNFHLQEQKTS